MPTLGFGFGPLEAEFWRWAFLMTRIGAALFAAPFFGATTVAPEVRVVIAGALAALVAGWTGAQAPADLLSVAGMVAMLGEVLIGVSLGFVLQIAFAAPSIAAEIISGGMGMGLAATVDPQNGGHSQVFSQYFSVVLTLVFFLSGGHLAWLGLVIKSYSVFPPGAVLGSFGLAQIAHVLSFASEMFAAAVAIALPMSLVLLLTSLMTGVLSRSAPQLNLFSLGLPAAVVAGIAALLVAMPLVTDRIAEIVQAGIAAAGQLVGS